jgi:D-alanyl-D-alanine dipeptidase
MIKTSPAVFAIAMGLAAAGSAVAATPAEMALVGQYGEAATPLTLFERDGALWIDGAGRPAALLVWDGEGRYRIDGGGELVATKRGVKLDGVRLQAPRLRGRGPGRNPQGRASRSQGAA